MNRETVISHRLLPEETRLITKKVTRRGKNRITV